MILKAISAPRIFDGNRYHTDAALIWDEEHIQTIVPISELTDDIEHQHFTDALIAPGFIDIQVNGGGGEHRAKCSKLDESAKFYPLMRSQQREVLSVNRRKTQLC